MSLSGFTKTCTLTASMCALLALPCAAASPSLPTPNPTRAPAVAAPDPATAEPAAAKPAPAAATPQPATPSILPLRNPGRLTQSSSDPGAVSVASAPEQAEVADASDLPPLPLKAPEPPFNFEEALKPLLDYELSQSDRANLKESFRASYSSRSSAAQSAMKAIKDDAARKLAEWYFYRSSDNGADADRIEAFRAANPEWPSADRLRRRAEETILSKGDAKATKAFFSGNNPVTPAGKVALAQAHLETGNSAKASLLLRSAWLDPNLHRDVEKVIVERHGDLLKTADHKARIDVLLYQDRRSKLDEAMRVAKLLGDDEVKAVTARSAVVRRAKNAGKLLDALPEAAKQELGTRFSRIQWLRRNNRDEEAWELLRAAPSDPELLLDLDEWWIERRINSRAALEADEPQIAYEIVKNHGPMSGESYMDAEFMAGWIALRFLQQPETAKTHFVALRTAASDYGAISRAEYWLGRTEQALGKPEEAFAHFRNAAQYPFNYYGQLGAHAALKSQEGIALEVAPTPLPTQADAERLLARDAVRAIGILRAADLENIASLFFFQLARTLNSPAEVVLLAQLARRMDQMQASVRLSKIALNRGLQVVDYAFPINVLPYYEPLNDGVEPALLYALSRQESEFNSGAKSPAGAHGLLQLMPRTARNIARAYKVRYHVKRLTANPEYNVMLGAAHLRDLVDEFGGSYAMALAAYNAGGPRVMEWIERFGNPRDKDVDPIDWVEHIPFTETREYVQKILESLQVFRSRLEGPEKALQLAADLRRGKASSSTSTAAAD